jgi:hypothetical protein
VASQELSQCDENTCFFVRGESIDKQQIHVTERNRNIILKATAAAAATTTETENQFSSIPIYLRANLIAQSPVIK